MNSRWSFFKAAAAAFMGGFATAHVRDFRKRDSDGAPILKAPFAKTKPPQKRKANLRLHLGPSDAGRLMRNRTPDARPVALSDHDWFRRQLVGSSKRVRNMSPEERTRFQAAIKGFTDAQRAKGRTDLR